MFDLVPNFAFDSKKPLYVQLYDYIRDEITNERIEAHEKLPSIRSLSKSLEMSRTTIENTYHQLLVEGYIYSIPQKGYYVSAFDKAFLNKKTDSIDIKSEIDKKEYIKYDYKSEYVEDNNFDFNVWRKYMNRILVNDQDKLLTYGDLQGEIELRQEIIKYIYQSRGVKAKVDHIIIGAGVQPLLNILSILMKKVNITSCAIEDPGFNRAKDIFEHNNFKVLPIPVKNKGIDLKVLNNSSAQLCYVSPSHQFPTGSIMTVEQRIKLIKWAKEKNGYIIEDDYNSELRYSGKPIPAMHSFDNNEKIIYLGSFSTVLVPSIRISYIILPTELMEVYLKNKEKYTQTTSKVEQLTLAKFMKEGLFEKHIKRLKKNYSKKNQLLIKTVKKHMKDRVVIGGQKSGFNLLLKLGTTKEESQIVQEAKEKGLIVSGISEYMIVQKKKKKPIIILSYRGIDAKDIDKSISILSEICFG